MNRNDTVTLTLTDLNNLGCGVGRLDDGRVVFVPGGIDGDTVTAKLIKINAKYCVAKLEAVTESSPHRADTDFCSAPESCGGCVYRHVTYGHELLLKREYVRNEFVKAGLREVSVGEVLTTGRISGYRNKAQYPVRSTKSGLCAGFYAARTHRLTEGADCPLQPAVFADIVDFILRYCEKHGVNAYDETTGSGLLRHIYIREGKGTGQIMVCPVLRHPSAALGSGFAASLKEKFPCVASVMLNYNKKETNVVTGDEYVLLAGEPYIEDILLGMRFHIAPASFWQVNHDGAELLYSEAARKAGLTGNETLLDLYCGTGSIGLTMAKNAKRLIGIEIVPEAVACAKENAKLNGAVNAAFFCGDASCTEGILASAEKELGGKLFADTVILDPPRKGSTPELLNYISGRGIGRIIYVSCAPDTLARDCSLLLNLGYRIEGEVTPVDMFPRTGHVECVVLMSRVEK